MPVHAQTLSYTKFHSDIVINNDASIAVTETIDVNFSVAHHGIYRAIPYRFSTLDGSQASIPITIDSVDQDGSSAQYTTSTDGTYDTVKIGDANTTITGSHEYVIHYTAEAAVNFFTDHDELYWNVTGDQWDAALSNVSASITFADVVKNTNGASPMVTQTACYTGAAGSKAQDCTHEQQDSTATFSSQDFLTVVVGWPKGFVTQSVDFATLRNAGTTTPQPSGISTKAAVLIIVFIGILFILGLLFVIVSWSKRDRRAIIAQYDPPPDVKPGEVSELVSSAGNSTVISATIIDLAVHGFLRIEEKEDTVFLGLGHTKSYDFVELKKPDDALRPYERQVLDALFRQPEYPAVDGRISLSTFKTHRTSTYQAFATVSSTIDGVGTERGWFAYGSGLRSLFRSMTPTGRDLLWYLKGFRLFLKTAEQHRLQWQEKEHIFETLLPYAMVLGVATEWSKTLAPLMTQPPDWYRGDFSNGFNGLILYTALSGLTSQVAVSGASGVSAAASGGSGFGGGGFSGGGGGGGGGGGW